MTQFSSYQHRRIFNPLDPLRCPRIQCLEYLLPGAIQQLIFIWSRVRLLYTTILPQCDNMWDEFAGCEIFRFQYLTVFQLWVANLWVGQETIGILSEFWWFQIDFKLFHGNKNRLQNISAVWLASAYLVTSLLNHCMPPNRGFHGKVDYNLSNLYGSQCYDGCSDELLMLLTTILSKMFCRMFLMRAIFSLQFNGL